MVKKIQSFNMKLYSHIMIYKDFRYYEYKKLSTIDTCNHAGMNGRMLKFNNTMYK